MAASDLFSFTISYPAVVTLLLSVSTSQAGGQTDHIEVVTKKKVPIHTTKKHDRHVLSGN